MPEQEVVIMLLANEQGNWPGVLTKSLAKPAVPYGRKYRTVGFPLPNCVNSRAETAGVLTQYQSLVPNDYIGSGQLWDPDNMDTDVYMLTSYQRERKADWCRGTANTIYQNIPFTERYHLDYVVVLSGDYTYKMDYSKMIVYRKERETDYTIAQIEVSWEETSRFGILNAREDGSVYEFNEKPKKLRSNKASMGIYVFSQNKPRKYLGQDEADSKSSNDFSKDLLPTTLEVGERISTYEFNGYWKDVGTIENLWESNTDLLDPHIELDLGEPSWKTYSRNPVMSPHYPAPEATVQNSPIAEGCNIYDEVDSTMLSAGIYITPGAVVCDSVIMSGSRVEEGAVVQYVTVSENAAIGKDAVVDAWSEEMGDKLEWGVAVVDESCVITPGTIMPAKTTIDAEEVAK